MKTCGVELESIPLTEKVAVEGGLHTLRPELVENDSVFSKGVYYFQAPNCTPVLHKEIFREPSKENPNSVWVVLYLENISDFEFLSSFKRHSIKRIQEPSSTEENTLICALELYHELCEKGYETNLIILIGDLFLPSELRKFSYELVPYSFRSIVGNIYYDELLVVSESRCRNVGNRRVVRTAKRLLVSCVDMDDFYKSSGASIIDESKDEDKIYMTSDMLYKEDELNNPVIALTRSETKPSCSTTVAGKLNLLLYKAYTYFVLFHDASDDMEIRKKCLDGFRIAASFFSTTNFRGQLVTLYDGVVTSVDFFDSEGWVTNGARESHKDLLTDVNKARLSSGIDISDC